MRRAEYSSRSEAQTLLLGEQLGSLSMAGDIILLYGELGAGKTCLNKLGWFISQAQPGVIRKAKRICRQKGIPLVVGAGVNRVQDVLLAKKLGAAGVLVSSAVVLAKNPEKKLKEIVRV